MVDSSSAALLSELNQKQRRFRIWPLAATAFVIVIGILVTYDASPWLIGIVAAISLACTICAYQLDLLSKTVVILYDFDANMESAYEKVHSCIAHIARCGGKWHIDARGHVYDPKYHGGAGQLVRRKRVSIGTGQPPYVKTNFTAPVIPLGDKSIYFFPERLLVFGRTGVGAVSYADLSVVVTEKRFIEDAAVPHDAQVVDQTWQYVNKKGGPDRRFSNNRQIPICLYEELWLNSPSGLNEVIQISRTGLGQQLDESLQQLADLVANAAAAPPPEIDVETPTEDYSVPSVSVRSATQVQAAEISPSAQSVTADRMFEVLLDVLCCLMVADGRASGSEKRRVLEVMRSVRSPWSDSEIRDRISTFIERVQNDGYRRTLGTALKDVEIFKHVGKQEVLLKCLDSVARADDKLSDRELQLCKRVKAAVDEIVV